jgi:hypothetical protein
VPADIRKQTGIGARNAKKRDVAQLTQGVHEWVEAKFNQPRKAELRQHLCPGDWTKELVVGSVKHEEEIDLLKKAGVTVAFNTEASSSTISRCLTPRISGTFSIATPAGFCASNNPPMWAAPTAANETSLERDLPSVDTVSIGKAFDRLRPIRADNQQFIVVADVMHFATDKVAAPLEEINHDPRPG